MQCQDSQIKGPRHILLCTVILSRTTQHILEKAGFVTVGDFDGIGPSELSDEINVSKDEAERIYEEVQQACNCNIKLPQHITALELLRDERRLSTCSSSLDDILGGGIHLGSLTEVAGPAGVGKTQLCLQLCASVQVPGWAGGLGGEAVYLDTEGSFHVRRLAQIADATVTKVGSLTKPAGAEELTVRGVLDHVHYMRVHDHDALFAAADLLTSLVQRRPKVALVIIDSVAFPFRYGVEDQTLKTRLLHSLAQSLSRIAREHQLAVVLVNQVTTRLEEGGEGCQVPALGPAWMHCPATRFMLQRHPSARRSAALLKSPDRHGAAASFYVTAEGIRDKDTGTKHAEPSECEVPCLSGFTSAKDLFSSSLGSSDESPTFGSASPTFGNSCQVRKSPSKRRRRTDS